MKSIGKAAAELVGKAVGALRRRAGVLRARLLFLASPRRRAAVLAGISRHIRALTPRQQPCQEKQAAAAARRQRHYYCCRGARRLAPADDDEDDGVVVPFRFTHQQLPASLLLVAGDGSDGECTADSDWTLALRSLFDADDEAGGGHRGNGDCCLAGAMDGLDGDEEETSVIDAIRRRREGEGQEFRIEDEIDRAADMYITRVRRRMSAQLQELAAATNAGSGSH